MSSVWKQNSGEYANACAPCTSIPSPPVLSSSMQPYYRSTWSGPTRTTFPPCCCTPTPPARRSSSPPSTSRRSWRCSCSTATRCGCPHAALQKKPADDEGTYVGPDMYVTGERSCWHHVVACVGFEHGNGAGLCVGCGLRLGLGDGLRRGLRRGQMRGLMGGLGRRLQRGIVRRSCVRLYAGCGVGCGVGLCIGSCVGLYAGCGMDHMQRAQSSARGWGRASVAAWAAAWAQPRARAWARGKGRWCS
jgi:hypothetical protein